MLYSHALGTDREEATAVAGDLAGHGYIVVTIDHIHDADVVELPDGTVATSAIPDDALPETIKAVESRAADVSFALDQLTAMNRGHNPDQARRPLPDGLRGAFDLDRVGMFGHSDGGATTGHVLHVEPRVKAGVNLDGNLWTPEAQAGSDHALLLFGRQDLAADEASGWAAFRANQRGPKLQLSLAGSEHATFTDFAVLGPEAAPLLGYTAAEVTATWGSINGDRAIAIQRAYTRAYFDTYLRHRRSRLLDGPSPRYPEVTFIA